MRKTETESERERERKKYYIDARPEVKENSQCVHREGRLRE